MTIQTRTETYYYCTRCDKEYAEEDKEDGLVCISCTNLQDGEEGELGCQSCMHRCFEPRPEKIRSHLQGCGRWFCKDCTGSTIFFDGWYPSILCKECITKYGLEKFYGDDGGEALWNQIQNWRIAEFGSNPRREKDGKRIKEGEIQQKIFEKFYRPIKRSERNKNNKLKPFLLSSDDKGEWNRNDFLSNDMVSTE
ncbi:MAG: hypothetical protein K0S67_28 [Nitrososphaeraceae archaeon]|jgi:hypothetical protein|nr:hypothetical protein [Nitrososphaeraceae archaeon]